MSRKIQVLHVVGPLRRGGTEVWLEDIVSRRGNDDIQFSVLSVGEDGESLCARFRELNIPLHFVPATRNPLKMGRALFHALKNTGPNDAIHAHVEYFSGLVVLIASLVGIKTRIVHCHTDCRTKRTHLSQSRKVYQATMSWLIRHFATERVGASLIAAQSMFGEQPAQIIYCGVNLNEFTNSAQLRGHLHRREMGITPQQVVIGHIGRLEAVKRHELLIEILNQLVHRGVDAHLVCLGEGSQRSRLEAMVQEKNLQSRVHLIGEKSEIAEYLLGVFDLFVFSSRYEGLGLALVEAQAAGLPCVTSKVIPHEAFVLPELVTLCSVDADLEEWTQATLRVITGIKERVPPSRVQYLQTVSHSQFSAEMSFQSLLKLYQGSIVG